MKTKGGLIVPGAVAESIRGLAGGLVGASRGWSNQQPWETPAATDWNGQSTGNVQMLPVTAGAITYSSADLGLK